MSAHAKPAADAATPTPRPSISGLFGDWIRQGAEGFIATQKILLDLAAQQNALALTLIRERLGGFTPPPVKNLVDLAGKGVHNLLEAQKVLLDLASRQNAIVADGIKPTISGTPIAPLSAVLHQGIENLIVAQKHFLDLAQAQAEGAVTDFRQDKGVDLSRLTELAKDGVRTFIESQKKFLDIVEDEFLGKEAAEALQPEPEAMDVFEMAKRGVDSLVTAEKSLLDLAANQIDVNVKFAGEIFNYAKSAAGEPKTSLSEVMRKSVDSFVAAQKALVDLASEPRKAAAKAEEPEAVPATV